MQSPKKYTNKLIDETSPYLLQHAHNPVDWYPWSDEAFEKARSEDKPVIVSIGYSACHWCHVMENESFEDEATARVMNEHFVCIKVDMEERPDVDQIYMTFVQLTTGRGGWPMNVFLTPEKLPFFGGTYFPPSPRYGMPSWQQILVSVADAWSTKRDELLHSANDIVGELRRVGISEFAGGALSHEQLDSAFASFVRTFDATNGGFGGAPKFPPSMSLEFLLRYWKRTGNESALEMVKFTASKMAKGGIYDHLGGGFHRYAVDAIWLVPHFEKMLYDNAQLIRVYLHLYQIMNSGGDASVSGRADGDTSRTLPNGRVSARSEVTIAEFFKRIAVETLEYVKREMLDPSGAFYSTQDADSEGEEGKFFVWTPEEIVEVLGEEDGRAFCEYFDVTAEGNFEGKNILNRRRLAVSSGQSDDTLPDSRVSARIDELRGKLFASREKRIKPFRDEKVLAAWNGLMLAAFAEAARVLDDDEYLVIAKRNAEFILSEMQRPDREGGRSEECGERTTPSAQSGGYPSFVRRGAFRLLRTWKDGVAKLNGYIEDYANVADGLIELYQASGEMRYLDEARRLVDAMITEFWDEENGGFFFTSNDHEELIVRNKDFYDNATPSGNSVAADVLLRLAKYTGEEKYERFGSTVLRLVAPQIARHPQGFGRALSVMEFVLAPVKEIAIIGPKGNELERAIEETYLPDAVVALSVDASDDLPLLKDRGMVDGMATAYVCENFVCQRPVTSVGDLKDAIKTLLLE